MDGYIYKFTYIPSNKIYVGQHSGSVFDESYWGSGAVWKKVLQKANKDTDIKREVIEWCRGVSREELTCRENYWIHKLNSMDGSVGYNQVDATPAFWQGKHHTDETKRFIAECSSGRVWVNKDGCRKFIQSCDADRYVNSGWHLGQGVIRSDDARKSTSEKNSGRVRLTNGIKNIFVPKEDVDKYLSDGYMVGVTHKDTSKVSKVMTNGYVDKKVCPSMQDNMIRLGWVFGSISDFTENEIYDIRDKRISIKKSITEERVKKFSEKRKGHTVSEETRRKLREANLGKRPNSETIEKLRKSSTGRKHSDETKEKLRQISLNKTVSEETREKMRVSHLGSQSDRIWINNGDVNRRVTKEDFLNIYIGMGFVTGRKPSVSKMCRSEEEII